MDEYSTDDLKSNVEYLVENMVLQDVGARKITIVPETMKNSEKSYYWMIVPSNMSNSNDNMHITILDESNHRYNVIGSYEMGFRQKDGKCYCYGSISDFVDEPSMSNVTKKLQSNDLELYSNKMGIKYIYKEINDIHLKTMHSDLTDILDTIFDIQDFTKLGFLSEE